MGTTKIEVFYVLEFPDGKYVAIDRDSGCPYSVKFVRRAKLFEDEHAARGYQNVFSDAGIKLKTVIATIG